MPHDEVDFPLSVVRNVFFLSKSEKNPLVRQNCVVPLQQKKIEIQPAERYVAEK
jgi:hypothetical protein